MVFLKTKEKQLYSKNASVTGKVSNFQFNHNKSSLKTSLQISTWLVVFENMKRTICSLLFDTRNPISMLWKSILSYQTDLIPQRKIVCFYSWPLIFTYFDSPLLSGFSDTSVKYRHSITRLLNNRYTTFSPNSSLGEEGISTCHLRGHIYKYFSAITSKGSSYLTI